MDKEDWFVSFWICLVLLVLACIVAFDYGNGVKQMGEAICEKEYGRDYDYWGLDNKLHCKLLSTTESYDGLKVIINEET